MINSNYRIPSVYKKMNKRGFLDSESYLWLDEMEWMSIDEIKEYENKEYYVGLCSWGEWNGIYYAKNTEDAIFRQIIEYVASSNFYLIKEEAESYQVGQEELKKQLDNWRKSFQGILNNEYLNIINMLSQLNLKYTTSKYGEWYALLSIEEQDELIEKYIKFDLLDEEFEWYIE